MGDFLHYLYVTPMRNYPWWGLTLVFVGPLAIMAAIFGPMWYRTRPGHEVDKTPPLER